MSDPNFGKWPQEGPRGESSLKTSVCGAAYHKCRRRNCRLASHQRVMLDNLNTLFGDVSTPHPAGSGVSLVVDSSEHSMNEVDELSALLAAVVTADEAESPFAGLRTKRLRLRLDSLSRNSQD